MGGAGLRPWVARLVCSRAKFENYFSSGASPFKISSNFFGAEKNWSFDAYCEEVCTFLSKFVLTEFYSLLFSSNKKGPRSALWPCLA